MSKHYSIKSFFRDMPPAMLARYFHRQGMLQDFEFLSMITKAHREALFTTQLELPMAEHRRMEGESQEIFSLGVEAVMPAIIDEAGRQMREQPERQSAFVSMFSSLTNHDDRAMTVFLNYPERWRGATMLYHADRLPQRRQRSFHCAYRT